MIGWDLASDLWAIYLGDLSGRSMRAIYVGDLCGQLKVAIHARSGYTFKIMMEVLLVNLAWVLLMAVWGVAYFIQARADRAKGGRYIANLEPESKD